MLDDLLQSQRVYLDANVIIYLVEKNSDYHGLVHQILRELRLEGVDLISSELVVSECLMGAVRRDNEAVLLAYERFFDGDRFGIELQPVSARVLWTAPQVSVDFKLDLPDALHFATALDQGCDGFLTNDKGFTDGEPFPIVYRLSDF
ncbi:MAG: type II toxin-antitoxin system VapC family toxin [Alphaproteobacteria bacterium]